MTIESPQDLFLYEMGDIYNAEQLIALILPVLMQESHDPRIQKAYQTHIQETEHQIQNLERCFQLLENQPPPVTCYTVAGIKQQHAHFKQEGTTDTLLILFNLGITAKMEHYEIASYQCLVEKANLLGLQQCAQLLIENLQQEQTMLQHVMQSANQLGQSAAGT